MGGNQQPTRLAIYAFYDKDGIVDDYVTYLLNDLMTVVTDMIVVCNGKLTSAGRHKLMSITPNVVCRDDDGFDVAAWKYAMTEYWDWDKIDAYDELVLLNDSFFGPLYPFKQVFDKMSQRDVDFWGLSAHGRLDGKGLCKYGYVPAHIQTYFIVYREQIHRSVEFKRFWNTQPEYKTFHESVFNFETVLTKHFEDCGFSWDVLIDTTSMDEEGAGVNHYLNDQHNLLKRGFPVIKRKNFSISLHDSLMYSLSIDLNRCLHFVEQETNYDTALIWHNILRIYNIADIYYALHLDFILPDTLHQQRLEQPRPKTVVIYHTTYMDLLDQTEEYLSHIPEDMDIIVTTKPEKKKQLVEERLSKKFGSRLRVLLAPERGRDISAFLVSAAPYLRNYEYFAFCHDKKSVQMKNAIQGHDFQSICLDNMLASKSYIAQIIDLFERDKALGLLIPPLPMFGQLIFCCANTWTINYPNTKKLAEKLKISANISESRQPIAIGTCFWARRSAFDKLLNYKWEETDFPEEPHPLDGTIGHAVERILPFVAQDAGCYTGVAMTPEHAATTRINAQYMFGETFSILSHINGVPRENYGVFRAAILDLAGMPKPENNDTSYGSSAVFSPNIGVKGAFKIFVHKHIPFLYKNALPYPGFVPNVGLKGALKNYFSKSNKRMR
ncbi:MAG: rhamnan synthesis F family protein [Oscillibacter sp.]|jgi:rhamnosyltransferase|nr:rhamnan synthesis F family protein [Oscillibacter sp.]